MRILIVEDELPVLNFIKKGFKEHGFCVDSARQGRDGFFLAAEEKYDCIILDIMLPGLDGYEIITRLRAKGVRTPVIFLTAKDTLEDKVKGFDFGADDYLVKPFSFAELLARVRALTRRGSDGGKKTYQAGDLKLDISRRIVRRGRHKINLTPTEFNLLQYFLEHKGEVLTRTMISDNVWGYNFDSMTNVIDVHINNLRKKIDLPDCIPLIHTLRGVGYVLEEKK